MAAVVPAAVDVVASLRIDKVALGGLVINKQGDGGYNFEGVNGETVVVRDEGMRKLFEAIEALPAQ